MTLILVDGSNIAAAAFHAAEQLEDANGRPTGCLYGFLRMMRPMVERVRQVYPGVPPRILVAWDARRDSLWRRDIYDGYKASRDASDAARSVEEQELWEKFYEQIPRLKGLLPALGVSQIYCDRYEADDIAGNLVTKFKGAKIVLMSGDYDWLQLVDESVWVWQPAKARFVTPENFSEAIEGKYGAVISTTDQYVRMKAIMGDDGDDVPGAPGIGAKTAGKYVCGVLESTTKAGKPAAAYEKITAWINNPDGYERSLKLVDLRGINIPMSDLRLQPGSFNEKLFMDACVAYGFASIFDTFHAWIAPFKEAATSAAA